MNDKPVWWPPNPFAEEVLNNCPGLRQEIARIHSDIGEDEPSSLWRTLWDFASTTIYFRLIEIARQQKNEEVLRFLGIEDEREGGDGKT